MKFAVRRRHLPVLLCLLSSACGAQSSPPPPRPESATATIVLDGAERIRTNATVVARVFERTVPGAAFRDATAASQWSAEPSDAATIDNQGHFTPRHAGRFNLVARTPHAIARTSVDAVDTLPLESIPRITANAPLIARHAALDVGVDGRVRLVIDTLDETITAVGYRHDDVLPLRVDLVPTAESRSRGTQPAMSGGALVLEAEHDGLAFGRALVPYRGAFVDTTFALPLAAHAPLSDELAPRPPSLLARRVAAALVDSDTGTDVTLHIDATGGTRPEDRWVYTAVGMYTPVERSDHWHATGRIAARPLAPLGVHRRDSEQAFAVLLNGGGAALHAWDLTARLGDDAIAGSEITLTFEVSFHVPADARSVTIKRADLAPFAVTTETEFALRLRSTRGSARVAGGWTLATAAADGFITAEPRDRVDGFAVRFGTR